MALLYKQEDAMSIMLELNLYHRFELQGERGVKEAHFSPHSSPLPFTLKQGLTCKDNSFCVGEVSFSLPPPQQRL